MKRNDCVQTLEVQELEIPKYRQSKGVNLPSSSPCRQHTRRRDDDQLHGHTLHHGCSSASKMTKQVQRNKRQKQREFIDSVYTEGIRLPFLSHAIPGAMPLCALEHEYRDIIKQGHPSNTKLEVAFVNSTGLNQARSSTRVRSKSNCTYSTRVYIPEAIQCTFIALEVDQKENVCVPMPPTKTELHT